MSHKINGRIFLVGCPRSGTTLLQSLLAAHPQIASFPESHFFNSLVPSRPWLQKLGMSSRTARPKFKKFIGEIGKDEMKHYLPKVGLFMHQYAQAFVEVLDTVTEQQGKKLWLEKTPRHLYRIDHIEKLVEGAKFIHIVRNGSDVVASLYEVTRNCPQVWGGRRDIDQCIRRWIEDVQTTQAYVHKPNHTLVRYEQLIENPHSVLAELCEFIGVTFNETMLRDYGVAAQQIVRLNKPWKVPREGVIQNTNSKKFEQWFNQEQRQYILDQIAPINAEINCCNNSQV